MATTQKAAPAAKKSGSVGIKDAIWVIVLCAAIAFCNFFFNFGSGSNFEGGDPAGAPLNIWGTIYKGGVIVPVIHTLLLTVLFMAIERVFALSKCIGKEKLATFLAKIKADLKALNFDAALQHCAAQGGSVANVVRATVMAYKEADAAQGVKKEVKIARIQAAHEEAIAVEMPTLTMNLPLIATIVTLGTLTGLLGTVVGMIKSFQALASGGGGDSVELSTGISEALINTAFGIGTSWLAVVSYNFFTNRIDKISFALDEIGYSLAQTYNATHADEA
ncbi:MotA/TolQ/ExbB proton channel family protein [Prevotella sp. E2-28]|uniref:MotA/TolQ/ExbB proton channel family protein n=1 Tax=Prevotella sp. E2-28 TaxID=2913620 RepID=UPI001EDAA3CA|nr:MotA/TolQ/ExbB proton channel family protein [Prevotella sp. E2-28]UKK53487.1 MotA/TolQ/ExbB proton channel family protein [Prevotella sp. E2-28]